MILSQNHSLVTSQQIGGADRDRTDDLRLAKPALSQLSYSPEPRDVNGINELTRQANYSIDKAVFLVGLGRVELPTSPLSGVRSNQLSYRPSQIYSSTIKFFHWARMLAFRTGLSKLNSSSV